jgi:hypothetical protein
MRKEQTMTWDAVHRRGEVLRHVVDEANARCDGVLPVELPGVRAVFGDDLDLIAALQLRWHTHLNGHVERALDLRPTEPEAAVLAAWRNAAEEMPGVLRILDEHLADPESADMHDALVAARRKDWLLLAAMAGLASASDPAAARVGQALEEQARVGYVAAPRARGGRRGNQRHAGEPRSLSGLVSRLKSRLAA